jgi:peptide/nickel transport system permease protein
VLALIFVAAFAPWIATHDPYLPDLGSRLAAPNAEYWFGADELGRDI